MGRTALFLGLANIASLLSLGWACISFFRPGQIYLAPAVNATVPQSTSQPPVTFAVPRGIKPVYHTKTKVVNYTVNVPVRKTHEKIINYTVNVPLRETHEKVVEYTVNVPVFETHEKTVPYTVTSYALEPVLQKGGAEENATIPLVARAITEQKTKTVSYKTCKMVQEQRAKVVTFTTCKMVQEQRSKVVTYTTCQLVPEQRQKTVEYQTVEFEPIIDS